MKVNLKNSLVYVLRFTARMMSFFFILFTILAFMADEPEYQNLGKTEVVMLVFFFSMLVGFVVAWFKEKTGGIIILIAYAGFQIMMIIISDSFVVNYVYFLFPLGGILYLICDKIKKPEKVKL